MRAKEFLNDYAVDDLHVFGRHEEHYSLDDLMEEYAKIYHESEVKKLDIQRVSNAKRPFCPKCRDNSYTVTSALTFNYHCLRCDNVWAK